MWRTHDAGENDISISETHSPPSLAPAPPFPEREKRAPAAEIVVRKPHATDGPRVTQLIASSPPLDSNSAYCNLLQCTDFRDTCVVAEQGDAVLGWLSAYRTPNAPNRIFVWQVAVHPAARGQGLGLRMLDVLLERPAVAGADTLTTTITRDNDASWRLFTAFARIRGATLTKHPRFEQDAHFAGAHSTEWEACIALHRNSANLTGDFS